MPEAHAIPLDGTRYEARFRPSLDDAAALVVVAWFGGVGGWLLNQTLILALPLLFVVGCLLAARIYVAAVQWGKPALRLDREGIYLGRFAFFGRRSERLVPWAEVGAVVLFRRRFWRRRRPHIGLDGRGRPIPVPQLRGINAVLSPHAPNVPPWVVATSRPVIGWTLDRDELRRMLTLHAPHVQLVELH